MQGNEYGVLLSASDLMRFAGCAHATTLATKTLLIYGEGRGGDPLVHAVDKRTGEEIATVEIPAPSNSAPMSFMHAGKQYIVLPIGGGTHPGSLVALRLP